MGIYLNKRSAAFATILLAIISLLYSSTFFAPFNFDDEAVIKFEIVQEGAHSWFGEFYPPRYRHLFYSSLIFNYSQGQLNPFGYHLVNTIFHFFTLTVIFFIASITTEKGFSLEKRESLSIASLTTLLFAINPVHSETVNYISARAVGMSSFFYLAALLSFIVGSFREKKIAPRLSLYFLSFLTFLASILSKETALTFPIAVILYDVCFIRKECWINLKNRLMFFYLPLFMCTAFVVFKSFSLKTMIVGWWQRADLEYGLKQIQVIGHGIRLIIFPIGLTFDYDFPDTFFNNNTLIITTILLLLGIVLAITFYFPKTLTIISFCTFWFLITLAPTNSIFPRSDLLSERNLYLPSFGILFLFATTIYRLVLSNPNPLLIKKIGAYSLIIVFILQAVLLYKRNLIYKSNVLLWEDTLKKSPKKLRALHNLSHFYMAENNHAKAFVTLLSLANSKASPHYKSYAHSNLGSIYLQLGNYPKAENEFKSGIKVKPSLPSNHFNLGSLLASQGRNLEAKKSYDKAEDLYKNYRWGYETPDELYINKARVLLKLGLYEEAENSINDYLNRVPTSGSGHFVLAKIFSAKGKLEQALHEYSKAGSEPKLKAEAHNNRALIFIKKKLFDQALKELNLAITVSPDLVDAHYNLGSLLIQINGDSIKARRHLEKALQLTTSQEGADRIKSALKALP